MPTQLTSLTNVVAAAAGTYHSVALTSDGTVWTWGTNWHGELGDGNAGYMTLYRTTPMQVSGLTEVAGVGAGSGFSLAVKSDGTVWAWGDNQYGELGIGTTAGQTRPVQVHATQNSYMTDVVAVSAKGSYTLALKSNKQVWKWGDDIFANDPRQVPTLGLCLAMAAGSDHNLAVTTDGAVWAWGDNGSGQLGDGTSTDRSTPVRVSGLTGVRTVAADCLNSLAVKSDGTVWGWGANEHGELCDGTMVAHYVPEQITALSGATVLAAAVSVDRAVFLAQGTPGKTPSTVVGTWPAWLRAERSVEHIVVAFDKAVVNVSADDLALSMGTVVSVQGSGQGPYVFTLAGLPKGEITATLGGNITSTDGLALPAYQWTFTNLLAGDLNSDGYVNVGDLQQLVAGWGKSRSDLDYDPNADANGDGCVNVADLQILVASWSQ